MKAKPNIIGLLIFLCSCGTCSKERINYEKDIEECKKVADIFLGNIIKGDIKANYSMVGGQNLTIELLDKIHSTIYRVAGRQKSFQYVEGTSTVVESDGKLEGGANLIYECVYDSARTIEQVDVGYVNDVLKVMGYTVKVKG